MEKLARMCAWCGQFRSQEDQAAHAAGAKVTHGMCPRCEARVMAKLAEDMGVVA